MNHRICQTTDKQQRKEISHFPKDLKRTQNPRKDILLHKKYICALLVNDGNLVSCKVFEDFYGLPNSFLEYVSIIHAISWEWRAQFKSKTEKTTENNLSGKFKKIYQTFKCLHGKQPSCIQARNT